MRRWLAGRGIQYLGVLSVVATLNFLLPRSLPGGPLRGLAGEDVGELTARQREQILAAYGLDRPLPEQFASYLGGLLRGDFGRSFRSGRPVLEVVGEALPWTLLLVGTATVIGAVLGIALGVWSARRRQRAPGGGNGIVTSSLMVDSLPAFWVGMLLIVAFGVTLGWLPTFGARSPGLRAEGWGAVRDIAAHLVLPVTALVGAGIAQLVLITRSSMVSVLGADFLDHQQARGLPERRRTRHALRNGLLPVHTVLMLEIGWIVGGALVVETVFAFPGLGRLTFEAIGARDFPLMQGAFLLLSVTVIILNLLADLTYPLLDPRLRARSVEP